MERVNLKKLFMEMGNHLVLEQHFDPVVPLTVRQSLGPESTSRFEIMMDNQFKSTTIVGMFADWLNNCPEGREFLESQGIDWPVVKP